MNDSIRKAHERLTEAMNGLGFRLQPLNGFIEGLKVYDQVGDYVFAWQQKQHHLLFYLRKPALRRRSTLRQKAYAAHPHEQLNENNGGEVTIKLRSDADARALIDWLVPELPLDQK